MAVNMAAKTLKYLYISSLASYKDKWGVDSDILNVKNMITHSDKSKNVAIQDGGQYDRQNTERFISQLIGQLQRHITNWFWYNHCQGFDHS